MPPVVRDDRLGHIIRQIHVAESAVSHAVPVGYGRLVPDKDFIQGLELLVQFQAPVPAPGIAPGLEEPLQLRKPLQEETLGHPVLLETFFVIRSAKAQVAGGVEKIAEQLFIQFRHQVVPGAQVCPICAAPVVGAVGFHRRLLLAGVLHYGHLHLLSPAVAGGQTFIRAYWQLQSQKLSP